VLGLSSPCHNFQVFVGLFPSFVEGDRCEQLEAPPFPNASDINTKASSPKGCSKAKSFYVVPKWTP